MLNRFPSINSLGKGGKTGWVADDFEAKRGPNKWVGDSFRNNEVASKYRMPSKE